LRAVEGGGLKCVGFCHGSIRILNQELTFITDIPSVNTQVSSLVVKLENARAIRKLLTFLAVLVFVALVLTLNFNVKASFPEYERYVHTYVEPQGNWTYMEKPTFPVMFNEDQIEIGQNWSVVCPIEANRSYHVYCYGKWVNNGSEPKTDYDIYVYNPLGEMESYHTESAGLPEHLGTTVDEAFFVPKYSGNYTFVIVNDARESSGAQAATFMIIEDVECNIWHERYVEGKGVDSLPVFNTTWGYEFVTERQHVEVWVKVPPTLDMYEARLYLMADPKVQNETILNDVPLAWEPGLYGEKNVTDGGYKYGGYNLESQKFRGVAYASCEFYEQEMFLNWTSPHAGKSLYHLVLIGEAGNGTVEFLVKTEFGAAGLKPSIVPNRVFPQNETVIAYVSNSTDLVNATLEYSTDNWGNVTAVPMEIVGDRMCNATILGQNASTKVTYKIEAEDVLKNVLFANGSYVVKYPSALNLTLVHESVHIGENITVKGYLTPEIGNLSVTVYFDSQNGTRKIESHTLNDGTFSVGFQTEQVGSWEAQARFDGDESFYPSSSQSLTIIVEEPTFIMKYSLYIGGGAAAAAIVSAVIYIKKFKQ